MESAILDDIADPITPASILASVAGTQTVPVANGTTAPTASDDGFDLSKLKDLCLVHVNEAMAALTDDARLLLARLAAPPVYNERATLTARSPDGFLVELSTAKATPAELIAAVTAMVGWCKNNGYTPDIGRNT